MKIRLLLAVLAFSGVSLYAMDSGDSRKPTGKITINSRAKTKVVTDLVNGALDAFQDGEAVKQLKNKLETAELQDFLLLFTKASGFNYLPEELHAAKRQLTQALHVMCDSKAIQEHLKARSEFYGSFKMSLFCFLDKLAQVGQQRHAGQKKINPELYKATQGDLIQLVRITYEYLTDYDAYAKKEVIDAVIKFENARNQAAAPVPARAAMSSSEYRASVRAHRTRTDEAEQALAKSKTEVGYALERFGKKVVHLLHNSECKAYSKEFGRLPERLILDVLMPLEKNLNFIMLCQDAVKKLGSQSELYDTFLFTLQNYICCAYGSECDSAKGYVWEIAVTLFMHNALGTDVQSMNKIVYPYKGDKCREFDVTTSKFLVECKSINWARLAPDKQEYIAKQFIEQQKIAYTLRVPFVVISKEVIPHDWKQWLTENDIMYVDPYTARDCRLLNMEALYQKPYIV